MRGLHEEAAPPTSAMLAQEIRKLQQEGLLRGDEEEATPPKQDGKKLSPGSMWKKFSK
jgi:DNA-binding HxlR family transcriptional regulator